MANFDELEGFIEDLYKRYKIPLFKAIHRYLGNSTEWEDVFQEVFIGVIRQAQLLRQLPEPKRKAYIFMIAWGVSIDYIRRNQKNIPVDFSDDMVASILGKTEPPSFSPINRVDLELMMKDIPKDDLMLLIGRYYAGMSIGELAQLAHGTPVNIRSRLHRAKKKLLNEWNKAGLHLEDFIDG